MINSIAAHFEFINRVNHKPQALDKTSCYKCNGTKRKGGRAGVRRFSRFSKKIVFKKVLKEF